MKKISISKVKKELQTYNADPATSELIVNNVQLYNDLVDNYTAGEKKNLYLTYQLNVQISKQLESVKKFVNKTVEIENDPFTQLVNELKSNKPAYEVR